MKKESKIKVCIVHGYTSHCDAEWFPWLKKQLEEQGIPVIVPEMPDSDNPRLGDWLEHLENTIPVIDNNTILIGHSLGCITLLRYLLKKDVQVKGIILVSGFIDKNPMKVQTNELSQFTDDYLNIKRIKELAPYRVVITAVNDDIVPSKASVEMSDKLETKLIVCYDGKHFIAEDGYKEFPKLLEVVKELLKGEVQDK